MTLFWHWSNVSSVSFLQSFTSIWLQHVTTVTLETEHHINLNLLDTFLQDLLWEENISNADGNVMDLFRIKVLIPSFKIVI